MILISTSNPLFAITAIIMIAGAVSGQAQGQQSRPASNGIESRQDRSRSNPETSKFRRRAHGVVAVFGDRIYYDGGSVSETGSSSGPPFSPTNSTLYIDLSKSWSPASVPISEIQRAKPPSTAQSIIVDKYSECFLAWGGVPAPSTPELWRFCNSDGGDRAAWEKLPSDSDFGDYSRLAHTAYASTKDSGFAFGGRINDPDSGEWLESSDQYVSYNFTSKAWASYNLPGSLSSIEDRTLWGAKAVFVPKYGTNGLVFLLGGISGRRDQVKDGDAYSDFKTVHFLDPVTRVWHEQKTTATSDGFPKGRYGHCAVGVAGTDNTYEIYMFGGANNNKSTVYNTVHVLSLPSFTWSLAGSLSADEDKGRYGQACAVVGNSRLLAWGGLGWGEWVNTYLVPDEFDQGLGIFDLNTLKKAPGYDAEAAPYSAHSDVVHARNTRPTPAEWSTPEVGDLFETIRVEEPVENDPQPSSTPVGAIGGGVVGGVALVAIAAAVWFFVSRRRRTRMRSPPETHEEDSAAVKTTQYEPVPELVSPPAELHDQYRPAEMTGQGKEPPRQVHEMDGGYNDRS